MEIWRRSTFEGYENQYRAQYEAGSLQAGGGAIDGGRES